MLHMTLRFWNIGYVFIVWKKEEKNILEKKQNKKQKQNKTQFLMVKSQLMVYQNE